MASQPFSDPASEPSALARLRARIGTRAFGVLAALAIEALLLLLLLSLGTTAFGPEGSSESLVSFDVYSPPEQAPPEAEAEPERSAEPPAPTPQPAPPQPAEEVPPEPVEPTPPEPAARPLPDFTIPRPDVAIIPLARDDMKTADLARSAPPAPPRPAPAPAPAYGPAAPAAPAGGPGDSEVVGSAPNGEPLYAARWYREPGASELSGYLSTANSPGWALIACRTAPQWRVEDCVGLDEYPSGSNIQRAVLAAAWQFQVRPPVRGGESLVGSWVRIRIDYGRR